MKSIIRIAACTSVCLAAVIQSAAVSAAEQNGWETVGRRRYYYENGEALTGEQVIDGIPYLFAPNGVQQTGWQTVGGKRYFYDRDGNAQFGMFTWRGETYYVTREEGKLTDSIQSDKAKNFTFDTYGVMQSAWLVDQDNFWHYSDTVGETVIDGTPYIFDDEGKLLTGWQTASDGITRYYDAQTHLVQTGWFTDTDGVRCYADPQTGAQAEGMQAVDGLMYLFQKGKPCTGMQTNEKGDTFYFDPETAIMQTGFIRQGDVTYFFDPDGGAMKRGWITLGSDVYYAKEDGTIATGFIRADTGVIYYFGADGKRGSGPVLYNGKTYLLNSSGIPQTGWYTAPNGDRYYGDNTAAAITGMQTIKGETYYFNSAGIMQKGWLTFGNSIYYAGEGGAFVKGFFRIDGVIYFFKEDGARGGGVTQYEGKTYILNNKGIPQTGWYTAPTGEKYYANNMAIAVTGWQEIDNKGYYFYISGILAVSTTVDNFSIDANGVARSQMAVTVDNLLKNTNYTPTSIFSYHVGRYRYSRVESTRTVNQLISAGWDSLIQYTLSHRCGVCYHLAASYEYFCKRAGYTTRLIHATHSTGNHYWVQVLVNGNWQNYDPTYSNRNNISWDTQIALGNYTVLGVVETYYDARGAYTGCNYTAW